MAVKTMMTPGPGHPITIESNPSRIRVMWGDRVLADTRNALTMREATYPPVHYIPRKDADMEALTRSQHNTYCPYKGDCSYFSLPGGGARTVNAVWSYEKPHTAVAAIKEYLAFYPDRVTIEVLHGPD